MRRLLVVDEAGGAGPLVTWPLVITKGPHKSRQNLGIYRQQKLGKNRLIMRWLSHRGGALDFQEFQQAHPGELVACLETWRPADLPVTLLYPFGQQPRRVTRFLEVLRQSVPPAWQRDRHLAMA